ncbi:organic solute transporter Ostalpha-domain-containing protein [Pilobolus umbonatus]|nr:organic solute transporter Ostalpha-domain-containing protein [Pilobolus umbonatus]
MLHTRPPSENFFPGTLYSRDIFVGDPYTFLFVKRGILQFVYVKPVLSVITMALKATGNYNEGDFSLTSSYLYLTFLYNLTVCLSLWCLMVFFYATKKDLTKFRPLPKFLSVKAIIFFSFWQSVVIALMVFAGLIPEGEHTSIAIQDFLVCLEMVPFAIAHAFAFSYEDYFDQNVHSARMPIRKAIVDSLGLKDVYMDSLDTLRGSGFSYRSFEPSEGVPHIGSSRTSRIMAGLRYSNMTTKKHWLDPAPTSKYLSPGRNNHEDIHDIEDSEPLAFEDPHPSDDMEHLYKASRSMVFGDYNYPVIDFREPLWQQARRERQRGYGTTTTTNDRRHSNTKSITQSLNPREGCVDVIIEQGKGNYVLVDDLLSEPQMSTPTIRTQPVRKPTLSDVKRSEKSNRPSSIQSTLPDHASLKPASIHSSLKPPSIHSSLKPPSIHPSLSSPRIPVIDRYPEPSYSTPQTSYPSSSSPSYSNNAVVTDEPLWQWPDDRLPNKAPSMLLDETDDILGADVWK